MSVNCFNNTGANSSSLNIKFNFDGFCSWFTDNDNKEMKTPAGECIVETDIFGYCGMVIGVLIGMALILTIQIIVLISCFIISKISKRKKSLEKFGRSEDQEPQSTLKIQEIELNPTAAVENFPYQDPQSIVREKAPTGEVYTVPQIRSPKKTDSNKGDKAIGDESLPPANYTQLDFPQKEPSTDGGGRKEEPLSSVVNGGGINEEKMEYSEIIV